MGDIYTNPPQSRNEAILRATIDGTEYTDPPESRIEDLLLELKEAIGEGGSVEANPEGVASETLSKLKVDDIIYSIPSGGGTSDYTALENKPEINGVTLAGDKSAADLGLVGAETGKGLSSNDYTNADKAIVDGITAALADKVDKVAGKGLSTNDYTDADKAIVDGVTSALSGKVDKVQGKGLSTNDFTNAAKDKLDGIAAGAEVNVNADWNASSGDAQILNKPTLGTAAAKNATDTVTAGSSALVESGAVASAIGTAVADKADKVSSATNGNFAGLDSNGNLTDSGKSSSDFLPSNTPIPSITNCYQSTDTAETDVADNDYFPFYDTSTTAKRKTLWSNIKGKIKDYLFGFFSAGLINDNGYIKNQISGFSVEDSGTASANSVKEQIINYTENSVGSSVINMVSINGTKYMEQTINAQANTDTTFTFSSSELTYASVLDIFAGCKTADYDIPTLKSKTLSVSGSTGTLTLVYNVSTAYALTVRVYIRG